MGRDVPFKADAVCDGCGKTGAFDFMGDYLCSDCANVGDDDEDEHPANCGCEDCRFWGA